MIRPSLVASSAAFAAVLSIAATPAAAAEYAAPSVALAAVPIGPAAWDSDAVSVDRSRRHRGYRGRYRNRVDGGDILAGVLVLGGIAAIASAASNNNNNRRYDDRRTDYRTPSRGSGIDSAVDQCVGAIERQSRVTGITDAGRDASGWRVSGTVSGGNSFDCRIDNRGRVSDISYGRAQVRYDDGSSGYDAYDSGAGYQPSRSNNQYDAQTYAEAWRRQDDAYPQPTYNEPAYNEPAYNEPVYNEPAYQQPSYPGGPANGQYADDEYGG